MRTTRSRIRILRAIGGTLFAYVAGGAPSVSASDTNAFCPAVPEVFVRACGGCPPLEERVGNFLTQSNIPNDVRVAVTECAAGTSEFQAGYLDRSSARWRACVSKQAILDPEYKATLAGIVDKAWNSVSVDAIARWDACRSNVGKCGKQTCPAMPPDCRKWDVATSECSAYSRDVRLPPPEGLPEGSVFESGNFEHPAAGRVRLELAGNWWLKTGRDTRDCRRAVTVEARIGGTARTFEFVRPVGDNFPVDQTVDFGSVSPTISADIAALTAQFKVVDVSIRCGDRDVELQGYKFCADGGCAGGGHVRVNIQ